MHGKKGKSTTVTESAVQAALRRTTTLAPDEEKLMRMRIGAGVPRERPLERVGQDMDDAAIELLAYEIHAYMRMKELRQERSASPNVAMALGPAPSRSKEKIIRALRRKK